jgi:hypothetical protein
MAIGMENSLNGDAPATAAITLSAPHESSTPAPTPPPAPAAAPPADPQGVTCACGHPQAQHDKIALRYCLATAAGGLDRGCICTDAPKFGG